MITYKIQESYSTHQQTLKGAILGMALLAATAAYGGTGIQCDGVDITSAIGFARIMRNRNVVTGDTLTFNANNFHVARPITSSRVMARRLLQETQGDNVLEIDNQNSKPLRVILVDQNSQFTQFVGVVAARSTVRFLLDRDALYDSYGVKGSLGLLRQSVAPRLSYRKFYSKVTFSSKTFGTSAGSVVTVDTY